MLTKSFLQKRMIDEITRKSSFESVRSSFLKFAERTSGDERKAFLAMYKAVTIIFSKPLNLERKMLEFTELNRLCVETLQKYEDFDENLQLYLQIFEFNCQHIEKSRSLSA